MYIETHCHLYKEYYDDIDREIKEAIEKGIKNIIVSAVNKESALEVLDLSEKYSEIYLSLGVQPSLLEDTEWIEEFTHKPKVVAIGEIGLDYYYSKDTKEEQVMVFRDQLDIATKYDMSVIIHCRDAHSDMISILNEYDLEGVIHSFTGNKEEALKYIDMGYLLGINGIITFKKAEELCNVIKDIDLSYIVLETDSPYLAPTPYRGKQNRVIYLVEVAKKISEIKNLDVCKVEDITSENALRIFDKMR